MEPISYTLIRSSRRTTAIQITPEGQVIIRTSHRTPKKLLDELVAQKEPWIRAQLARFSDRPKAVPFTPQELADLKAQARRDLSDRAARWAAQMGISYGRVTVRAQRSVWGSCSSAGNLSFNCLLMCFPPEIRDYVVVHELCHRRQMNHSPAFWAEVAKVLPDWPRRRAWLKEHGAPVLARLPRT